MRIIEIHETAYVTSIFRSLDEGLSGDKYAKLWHNRKAEAWVKSYLKYVCSEEVQSHCLRNRYFLDTLNHLIEKNKIEVLINFGCGFSMYPFLIRKNIIHIEIDKPEIIEYKKLSIKKWQKINSFPYRKVHYLKVDFSESYQADLARKINSIKGSKNCFILLEGVLFFLSRTETNELFDFFRTIQVEEDFIGSASFKDCLKGKTSYQKLLSFLTSKVVNTDKVTYQTIPEAYYSNRSGYELIDKQDYFSLSKRYNNRIQLDEDLILNEHYYLLKRIKS